MDIKKTANLFTNFIIKRKISFRLKIFIPVKMNVKGIKKAIKPID